MAKKPALIPFYKPSRTILRHIKKRKQPEERPLQLRQYKFVTPIDVTDDKLVLHRRGPRREVVGGDPLEQRAAQNIQGTLPERVFYQALVRRRYVPGADFDFQSSLMGGRVFLGGMVADFIFFTRHLIVRVQGWRWHQSLEATRRDDNQRDVMERMGYTVLDVSDTTVLDELLLEHWLRANIDTFRIVGGPFAFSLGVDPLELELDVATARELLDQIHLLQDRIGTLEGLVNPNHTHPHLDIGPMSASKILAGELLVEHYIQSTGFTSGTTGFKIEGGGDAEFGNITARGELKTTGVVKGTTSAYGGDLVVASGIAILIADVASDDGSIDVKNNDLVALDNVQFQASAARVEWMRIREVPTTITGGYRYPVDRGIAGTAQAWSKGEVGVAKGRALLTGQRSSNWGEDREGATANWSNLGAGWGSHGIAGYFKDAWPQLTNTDTEAYVGINQRSGSDPDDGITGYARMGSLDGFLSYSGTPGPLEHAVGLAVGLSNNFMSWDPTNGFVMYNKTGGAQVDSTGFISQDVSGGSSDWIRFKNTSGAQKAHVQLATDDSVYMFPLPGEGFGISSLTGSTYKNVLRLGAAESSAENGMTIAFYDVDAFSYSNSDLTARIWSGSDSGGSYAPEDLHIGAKDDVVFYTDVDGTPTIVAGITESGLFTHSVSALIDGVTAPGTAAGLAQIYIDTADGDLKVKFGDGHTVVLAADS